MIGYDWNIHTKAYDLTSRAKRRAYHIQMESIREVNARIMRKNLRRVFKHQKQLITELDDPTDFVQVNLVLLMTSEEMRRVFAYSYKRVARDIYPMLVNTPKAKSFICNEMKSYEKKADDPGKQYYDYQLAQWVENNLGVKIAEVQQTTLNQLRKAYTLVSQGYDTNALQSEFRDEVVKAFIRTFDTNISVFRANCIARTECAAATNRSSLEVTKAMGGDPRKEWMSVLDMDTRDTHAHMNGKIVGLEEMFNVNGSLMDCPLDSTHGADVKEIANCRCMVGYHYD